MAFEIKMPKLSQTTEEVRFIRWLVEEGQNVEKGDPICEVETDKTTMDVESYASGTVLKLYTEPDTVVLADTLIAVLGEPGEEVAERPHAACEEMAGKPQRAGGAGRSPVVSPPEMTKPDGQAQVGRKPAAHHAVSAKTAAVNKLTGKADDGTRATPLVRNIARKRNIDLAMVRGSGPRGLITKKDLEKYAESQKTGTEEAPYVSLEGVKEYPLSRHQILVARNVFRSKTEIPHYYLKCKVFADYILKWREKNRMPDGTKVSMYSLFVHAAVKTLEAFPGLNGYFKDDRLVQFQGIHVGFAVTAGDDLYVPVIKNTDKKDIWEIDKEVKWLVAKAQNEKLEPQDVMGGSFTVTNLGKYPIEEFCAVINYPQAAILATGTIGKTLHIDENNAMHIKSAFTVTGSFDHRIVNGAQGAAFLEKFKRTIEEEIQ
jgi:pyruvate dehydrogenase E2 component (dihydrolipoamide acetyltransferase)